MISKLKSLIADNRPQYPVRAHRVTEDIDLSSEQHVPEGSIGIGQLRHYDSGINREAVIKDYRQNGDFAVLSGDDRKQLVGDDAEHIAVVPGEFVAHPYPDKEVVLLGYWFKPPEGYN